MCSLPSRCPPSLDQCLLNDKWAFVTECTADRLPLYIFGPFIAPAPLLDVRPQLAGHPALVMGSRRQTVWWLRGSRVLG